ncbi:protein mon2 homolog, partial [Plakobranchus ocellatus]
NFCQSYDMKPHSTKIFRDIVNALGAFIQSQFMNQPGGPAAQAGAKIPDTQGTPPAIVHGMPVGSGVSPQPAFMYRGVWIPLNLAIPHGQTKGAFLELLDKTDPPGVPDGYGVSLAFRCLMETTRTVNILILGEAEDESQQLPPQAVREKGKDQSKGVASDREMDVTESSEEDRQLHLELINSSWCGILAALSLLLDASTDESATENILKAQETYAHLCGHLGLTTPRDAFITALCKASLPPHYTLTVLGAGTPSASSPGAASKGVLGRTFSQELQAGESVERSQVVAVGTALPTASLPAGSHQGQVMLTAKNIQVMRALLSLAHCHGDILGTAWHLVLTTLQVVGGSLKAGQQLSDGGGGGAATGTVITTAVMADLPILSAMLSRLFESSQYLDDVALHHLIDALCKLSAESMELAYSNRGKSWFACLIYCSNEMLWSARTQTGYLDDVALHHLIDALCKLSAESMELAYSNRILKLFEKSPGIVLNTCLAGIKTPEITKAVTDRHTNTTHMSYSPTT